jgi:hypothetical protein
LDHAGYHRRRNLPAHSRRIKTSYTYIVIVTAGIETSELRDEGWPPAPTIT